ncbi:Conserved hypothetical protein CHP02466 [uncultured Caudovirales phage]|uniref:Uncharacterized protein n=1 Tax=uncultured Caudovirales phage TaxID=2100421 RepID=A0A6J7WVL4_9CAUD|nr:Conserved hypothetical protein CHP02466 [uncultured Caudovirales phage]
MTHSIDIIKVSAHVGQIHNVDFTKVCEESYGLSKILEDVPLGSYEKSIKGYPFYSFPKTETFNQLHKQIEETANKILPIKVRVYETWVAIIEPGQSVAYHTHYKNSHVVPEHHWSGVVFANANDGSAELVLHGYALNRVESFTSITPEVGKVVFFNSFVPHFTTVNASDTQRVTISFNLWPVDCDVDTFPNNHKISPDNYGEPK